MLTVRQLIKELEEIKNKDLPVGYNDISVDVCEIVTNGYEEAGWATIDYVDIADLSRSDSKEPYGVILW